MAEPPTASIIIPAYNAAPYLGRAIESCLVQTQSDIEIVIVDDGSGDRTSDIANGYARADKRVTVITNAERLGPAGARNVALRHATGRWIALLDADDAYDPSRIDVMVKDAEARDCDLLADNLQLRDRVSGSALGLAFDPQRMSDRRPLTRQEFVDLDNSRRFWALGMCKPILRHEFLSAKLIDYDTTAWVGQDFDIYFRCLTHGARFCLSDMSLYEFTIGGHSHSSGAGALQSLLRTNARLIAGVDARDHDVVVGLKTRQARLLYELLKLGLRHRSITLVTEALRRGSASYTLARLTAAAWKWCFRDGALVRRSRQATTLLGWRTSSGRRKHSRGDGILPSAGD